MVWGISHAHDSTPDYGSGGDTYPSSLTAGAGH